MAAFGTVADVYFGGRLDAGIALSGQVAGRIDASRPVAEIIGSCVAECEEILASLSDRYVHRAQPRTSIP
jgi:enoyl-[acyl-carrier protein] reductase II